MQAKSKQIQSAQPFLFTCDYFYWFIHNTRSKCGLAAAQGWLCLSLLYFQCENGNDALFAFFITVHIRQLMS